MLKAGMTAHVPRTVQHRASQPADAELIFLIKTVRSSGAKPRWSSLRPPFLAEPDEHGRGRNKRGRNQVSNYETIVPE